MKFARFTYGTFGFLAVGSLAWGCSSKTNDCDANKTCGPYGASGSSGSSGESGSSNSTGGKSGSASSGEGGASGEVGDSASAGNAGSGGAPCIGTSSPDTTACVIDDSFGIFVSLAGDDTTGDGTEAHPLATITHALTLTGPGKINRLYVCATANGNSTFYDEPDILTIPDRVSIYGGFTCAAGDWKYVVGTQAYIKPESTIGATISSAKTGVTLQDVRIDAQDALDDGSGASSFGLIVNTSQNVVLTRVEIHAGKGGGGAKGADGVVGADGLPSSVAQNGAKALCVSPPNSQDGGKSVLPVCISQGGAGGRGSVATKYDTTQNGDSGFPKNSANSGAGGMNPNDAGGVGQPGLKGTPGMVGAAASTGTLSGTGYAAASGGDGTSGTPGQGGGGGGASLGSAACVGASGGAGGMGGCGGNPGKGGVGGGASVGLLSWQSDVTIVGGAIVAVAAGAGGSGGAGGAGGSGKNGGDGGTGDPGHNIGDAGDGGKGGPGGNGGNGSGGTGGPSIALAFAGEKPVTKDTPALAHAATAATGGTGGQLGDQTNWGTNGGDGLVEDSYQQL